MAVKVEGDLAAVDVGGGICWLFKLREGSGGCGRWGWICRLW